MDVELPVKGVIPIEKMIGDDEEETALLHDMEQDARRFLSSFPWCESIEQFYFGAGVGKVFGVFFARITPSREDVDEYLWVVVGDLPPAYLVTDDCRNPREALEGYIWEMRKWVKLAKDGKASTSVTPVNAPATPEWANVIESRLNTLEEKIIPVWFSD